MTDIFAASLCALLFDALLIVIWEPLKKRDYPNTFSRAGAVMLLIGFGGFIGGGSALDNGEALDPESMFWPSFWLLLLLAGLLLLKVALEYENRGNCFLCSILRHAWGASYRCPLSNMVRAGTD